METQTAAAPGLDRCRRILVVNAKGGCGKTTVATNLCAAYAARGKAVGLVDNDGQGAGAYWTAQRPADAPQVELTGGGGWRVRTEQAEAARQRAARSFAAGGVPRQGELKALERIVIDGQANGSAREADELLALADVILTPVLPSAIDIRAGGKFITALMTRPEFRAAPRPIGVIANRVQPNSSSHARLMHFLGCLNVPVATTLRDSPLYGDAMGSGLGVADLFEVRAARREMTAWRALVDWLEEQLPSRPRHAQPLAAGRPSQRRLLSA